MQARLFTKFIFPEGEEPGLKSVAKAIGKPASIIFRAGVYGIRKKKEHAGSATGIVFPSNKLFTSSSVNSSK